MATDRSQVWLPYSGVMITACPDHDERPPGGRTHADVQEMAECPHCTKETLRAEGGTRRWLLTPRSDRTA